MTYIKKDSFLYLSILVCIICFNCSSSDDNSPTLDTDLLYGQWYRVGLCQEQNNLLLNANKSYVSRSSGAVDCNDPAPDTYQFDGTFTLSGNTISYNQQSAELVIDGTDLTVLDFPNPDIVNEIVELNENSLVIRAYIPLENNVVQELGEASYEH